MKQLVIDLLLAGMVGAAWLGVIGFVRLREALDRIHCIAFVNAVCGGLLLVSSFLADGASDRVLKIFLMVGLNLVAGAAVSHVTARAILQRQPGE